MGSIAITLILAGIIIFLTDWSLAETWRLLLILSPFVLFSSSVLSRIVGILPQRSTGLGASANVGMPFRTFWRDKVIVHTEALVLFFLGCGIVLSISGATDLGAMMGMFFGMFLIDVAIIWFGAEWGTVSVSHPKDQWHSIEFLLFIFALSMSWAVIMRVYPRFASLSIPAQIAWGGLVVTLIIIGLGFSKYILKKIRKESKAAEQKNIPTTPHTE